MNHDNTPQIDCFRNYTDQETADFLKIKRNTLAHWRTTGRYGLPYLKIGSCVRYSGKDLLAWLETRKGGAA